MGTDQHMRVVVHHHGGDQFSELGLTTPYDREDRIAFPGGQGSLCAMQAPGDAHGRTRDFAMG